MNSQVVYQNLSRLAARTDIYKHIQWLVYESSSYNENTCKGSLCSAGNLTLWLLIARAKCAPTPFFIEDYAIIPCWLYGTVRWQRQQTCKSYSLFTVTTFLIYINKKVKHNSNPKSTDDRDYYLWKIYLYIYKYRSIWNALQPLLSYIFAIGRIGDCKQRWHRYCHFQLKIFWH